MFVKPRIIQLKYTEDDVRHYSVTIKRHGFNYTKLFDTMDDAEAWAQLQIKKGHKVVKRIRQLKI